MMKAVVIDDSELARKNLMADIKEFCPEIQLVGEANDVISGAKLVKQQNPDILFLDIEMGEHDGFDLLDIIGETNANVVFVTGSKEYAIKAFQVNAMDYLLKPIDPELLQKAIEKVAISRNSEKNQEKALEITLSFHTIDEVRWAKSNSILRLEAEGNYTTIFFADGTKLMVTKTLKEYDQKLSKSNFIRVHQSHLVNKDYIKSFVKTEGGYLMMENGDQVSVSVRKRPYVMEILENS